MPIWIFCAAFTKTVATLIHAPCTMQHPLLQHFAYHHARREVKMSVSATVTYLHRGWTELLIKPHDHCGVISHGKIVLTCPFPLRTKARCLQDFLHCRKGTEHIYVQNLPLSKKPNNCYWELIKFWFRLLSADERRQREQSVRRLFTFHSWPDLWEQRRRLCAEQRRVCSQRRGEDQPPRCFDKVWDTIKCHSHCVNASRSAPPLKSDFQQFTPADSCVRIPDPNCPDWLLMSTTACCIFRRRPVDKRFWSLWSLLPSMLIFQWVQKQ